MTSNPQYIEKWVGYLQTADREMSRIAAQKLGATKDPSVVPPLLKALHNRPDDVRTAAMRALGEIGHASAVPELSKLLKDQDPVIASTAAEALGEIGDPRAVKPLIDVISRYKQEQTRHTQIHGYNRGLFMACIYALQQIDTPEARRAIRKYHR